MIGTVRRPSDSRSVAYIQQVGEFPNCYAPEWILTPAPRDGFFIWRSPDLADGTPVSFQKKDGTGLVLPGGTFTTDAIAINVVAL